jgi:hypothetical protein
MSKIRSLVGMGFVLAGLGLLPLPCLQMAAEAGHAKIRNVGNSPLFVNVAFVTENEFHVLSHGWLVVNKDQEVVIPFTLDKGFVHILRANNSVVNLGNREKRPYPIHYQPHAIKINQFDRSVTMFESADMPGNLINTRFPDVPPNWRLVEHYAVSDTEILMIGP